MVDRQPVALDALLVGNLSPIDDRGTQSGIDKHPIYGSVQLGSTGFTGDHQGDLKRHGGVDKAVHHYPWDHYRAWTDEIGPLPLLKRPGAFGENLSTLGLTESDVAVGDRFRLGGALLEVSQGRQPCWKLNRRFDLPDMARRLQHTGRTGWYYRVIEGGLVSAGDRMHLVERRHPVWTIGRLWHFLYVDTLNRQALEEIANLAILPSGWREYAVKRLQTRKVEDWSRRLDGETTPVNG
ncbi:MOSC domain-containing protein [Ensifer adhaerens]|uniref:MOSC domain-containing protein n=1 Tax=Ensifer adhaerens TaxID=106592 RepID=UPI001CBD226B|nr:MOSC domain-containing protein [Ensifer adhaerens]MBZ7925540.1 MOSC domain-containing protein [Ensifer adhaerens]UAX95304.1 MOSC domain-containing protein [Ensifer adhaerens]UAY02804.1 MOSC domain-containing protein [Ensifer adhaerens]UAY10788.1 MOSC domain-containing protein [Ensifer adhaerens]